MIFIKFPQIVENQQSHQEFVRLTLIIKTRKLHAMNCTLVEEK